MNQPSTALRTLLSGLVDYAGLFPPAQLAMDATVRNYAAYRQTPEAWMLGRLIVPALRLDEFKRAFLALPKPSHLWHLSVLVGDPTTELPLFEIVRDLAVIIDTVELRATTAPEIAAVLRYLPADVTPYVEIPANATMPELVTALAAHKARAKIRTGGVTSALFPQSGDVIRFMAACIEAGVPFKATAGLHHPLRGDYRLTYAPDSPSGAMFGFLGVFLAAAGLLAGWEQSQAEQLLLERNGQTLQATDTGIVWQPVEGPKRLLSLGDLERTRRLAGVSFGSCSFTEPLEDLQALDWLGGHSQAV